MLRHCACAVPLVLLLAAPLDAQTTRRIAVGQALTDSLTAGDPVGRRRRAPYHVWLLSGQRGQRITINYMSSDFDPYLILRDADGHILASDDDSGEENNARLNAVLPREAEYRVITTAFSESGRGRYTLAVTGWEAPDAPPPAAVGMLSPGDVKTGLLEPGDEISGDGPFEDRWTFEGRPGARLRVEMRSSDFDAYLTLLGPEGQVLATDDDGLDSTNSLVTLRVAAAGRYTVIASTYRDEPTLGAYQIALLEETGDFPNPGVVATIAPGETKDGRLETGDPTGTRGYEDRWTFAGRASQAVRIDAVSSAFDPYLVLRFAEAHVDSNDDGGDGNNARILTLLPNNGTYTVIVSAYSENRSGGRYSLSLVVASSPPAAGETARLAPGQRVAGRLEPGDRTRDEGGVQDVWEFDGRAGQDLTVELRSAAFDTYLELVDSQGERIAENDDGLGDGTDSFLMARLERSGRHRIIVRAYGEREAEGLYELLLEAGSRVARPGQVVELRAGQTVIGRLEPGDTVMGDSSYADVFLFRPTRSGEATIELASSDFDTYLIVQDASGRTLGTDDDGGSGTDSRLATPVAAGAVYRVLANSYGADRQTGTYRITVRLPSR